MLFATYAADVLLYLSVLLCLTLSALFSLCLEHKKGADGRVCVWGEDRISGSASSTHRRRPTVSILLILLPFDLCAMPWGEVRVDRGRAAMQQRWRVERRARQTKSTRSADGCVQYGDVSDRVWGGGGGGVGEASLMRGRGCPCKDKHTNKVKKKQTEEEAKTCILA